MFGRTAKAYYALSNAINRASDRQRLADQDKFVAMKELSETLQEVTSANIASKDRVDIPLATYEEMKAHIEKLEMEVNQYRYCFRDTPIPEMMQAEIKPENVHMKTYQCIHPGQFEKKVKYILEFTATVPMDWRVES